MYKEDKGTALINKVINGTKRRKMGKAILRAITPMFKGESIESVDKALSSCQELLREECGFSLLSSAKK